MIEINPGPYGREAFEVMRAKVEAEIRISVIEQDADKYDFIGNFRNFLRQTGRESFDNPRKWTIGVKPSDMAVSIDPRSTFYSQKWNNSTPQEFFEDVDLAMELEGVSGRIVEDMDQLSKGPGIKSRERLFEYILPVYIRLRVMGYGHLELTS